MADRLLHLCSSCSPTRAYVLQLVLEAPPLPYGAPYVPNPRLSITRVGSRAYPRALDALANQIRLRLALAEDARRWAELSSSQRTTTCMCTVAASQGIGSSRADGAQLLTLATRCLPLLLWKMSS